MCGLRLHREKGDRERKRERQKEYKRLNENYRRSKIGEKCAFVYVREFDLI